MGYRWSRKACDSPLEIPLGSIACFYFHEPSPSMTLLVRRAASDTETQDGAVLHWFVPATDRRPAVPRPVESASAPAYPARARSGPLGVVLRRSSIVVSVAVVSAPFPHVAVHVIEALGIRPLPSHRVRRGDSVRNRVSHDGTACTGLDRHGECDDHWNVGEYSLEARQLSAQDRSDDAQYCDE